MTFKRTMGVSTLAAGIGLAGLLGLGLQTASAEPGPDCNRPGNQQCGNQHNDNRNDRGPAPVDWNHRGIDQGRADHQPFNWNGHQVTPMPAADGHGWGFWFLGTWIPL